jgi:hypothetical protein
MHSEVIKCNRTAAKNSKAMMVIGFMAYRRKSKTALMAVIDDNEI